MKGDPISTPSPGERGLPFLLGMSKPTTAEDVRREALWLVERVRDMQDPYTVWDLVADCAALHAKWVGQPASDGAGAAGQDEQESGGERIDKAKEK